MVYGSKSMGLPPKSVGAALGVLVSQEHPKVLDTPLGDKHGKPA